MLIYYVCIGLLNTFQQEYITILFIFLEVAVRTFFERVSVIAILGLLCSSMAVSGGYQLNEQNARAVGMGGAFVATASDPSAIYFNPAGLAFQNGINVLGGINFIMPSTSFTGSGTQMAVQTKTNSQVFTPFNVYGSYQVNDQFVVGLGIYNPFGLGTQWPDKWGQALNGIYVGGASSVNASVATYYFNPTIAYKINDQLSVGLGVSYVYGTVSMSQINPAISSGIFLGGYFKSQLDGTGNGYNANIGVMYKPIDNLSLGLSYRTTTKIDFSGSAKFTNVDLASPYWSAISASYPGGTGTATLPMPGNLYLGVAYQLQPDFRVEGDFQWVQWSTYDQLQINLTPVVPGGQGTRTSVKSWDDGFIFRIGAEYVLDNQWTVRAGAVEDLSPQPPSKTEPMLPDGDRTDLTVGGSYKINSNLYIDVAYMLVLFADKNAANSALPGTYSSTAHVVSVNFGYSF
jgi:long-chain fatty acid transport protein